MLSDLRCDIVGTMVWHWINWIDLRFIRRFLNASHQQDAQYLEAIR